MTKGIIIFGLNGTGKTTLGKALAKHLGYQHIDIEDYAFEASEIPYTIERSKETYISMIKEAVEKKGDFVLSAVTFDLNNELSDYYQLGVFIDAPFHVRIKRVEERSKSRFGSRVEIKGDMYESEMKFLDFVKSRKLDGIEQWARNLTCPILKLDGTKTIENHISNIKRILEDSSE